jgi:hypothetical protein
MMASVPFERALGRVSHMRNSAVGLRGKQIDQQEKGRRKLDCSWAATAKTLHSTFSTWEST